MLGKIRQFTRELRAAKYLAESDFLALLAKCRIKSSAGARVLKIIRARHNHRFIRCARKAGIEYAGCKLDAQQVEAVVACEDAQLVLASAGSGKTLSLLAKISYLNHECGILPAQILAISFTKKTVEELRERCDVDGVDFRTFHALGNYLIRQNQSSGSMPKELISTEEHESEMLQRLINLCENNPQYAHAVNDFMLFYLTTPHSPGEQNSHARRVLFNRLNLHTSLKNELLKRASEHASRTIELRGDFIRSKAEQLVAD